MTRVERSVRAEIDAVASALNDIAASVGREPALFDTAAADRRRGRTSASRPCRSSAAGAHARCLRRDRLPAERRVAARVERCPLGNSDSIASPAPKRSSWLPDRSACGSFTSSRFSTPRTAIASVSSPPNECSRPLAGIRPAVAREACSATDAPSPSRCARTTPRAGQRAGMSSSPTRTASRCSCARVTAESVRDSAHRVASGCVGGRARDARADPRRVRAACCVRWRLVLREADGQPKAAAVVSPSVAGAGCCLWLAPTARWMDQIFRTQSLGPACGCSCARPSISCSRWLLFAAASSFCAFDPSKGCGARSTADRSAPTAIETWMIFAVTQLVAGTVVALLLVGYEVLLGNAIAATSVDALHFSLASARFGAARVCRRPDPGAGRRASGPRSSSCS